MDFKDGTGDYRPPESSTAAPTDPPDLRAGVDILAPIMIDGSPPSGPFDRTELQQLRDRARPLSIPGSVRKTTEERLYAQMADIADHLDALAARREQNREALLKEPAREPCEPGCAVNHGNSSCVGRIGGGE